jgi:hypothetical protein
MKIILFVALFFVSTLSSAALGPMIFTPSAPTEIDRIRFTVMTFFCEGFYSTPSVIERTESVIRVTREGAIALDPILCVFGSGVVPFDIGFHPAGQYRIELYLKSTLSIPVGTFLVQTGNLTITGAPALAQAPALSSWSMLVLVLSVLGIGVVVGRKR